LAWISAAKKGRRKGRDQLWTMWRWRIGQYTRPKFRERDSVCATITAPAQQKQPFYRSLRLRLRKRTADRDLDLEKGVG